MKIRRLHAWPRNQAEAKKIQYRLRGDLNIGYALDRVTLIAGVDTAYDHTSNILYASACVFHFPGLMQLEKATAFFPAGFPYVPGLHAFREGPVILQALARLRSRPDVILFAGHGVAHPQQCGLASHLGLLADTPSIGVARRLLIGQHPELGPDEGESAPLIVGNSRAGVVYRSRSNVKPIYISPGYKCGIDDAVRLVTACLCGYRIPEPLRTAHRLANRARRNSRKDSVVPDK